MSNGKIVELWPYLKKISFGYIKNSFLAQAKVKQMNIVLYNTSESSTKFNDVKSVEVHLKGKYNSIVIIDNKIFKRLDIRTDNSRFDSSFYFELFPGSFWLKDKSHKINHNYLRFVFKEKGK